MKNPVVEMLANNSKETVQQFIRDVLTIGENRKRFDMSGYDADHLKGECTIRNINIINEFAFLGIYDYTTFLTIDFYKGTGHLYWQPFFISSSEEDFLYHKELDGMTTSEIIYAIFEITIFSGKKTRRRLS